MTFLPPSTLQMKGGDVSALAHVAALCRLLALGRFWAGVWHSPSQLPMTRPHDVI